MQDIVALLFGAVIIMFFSYERFNRTTYDGGQQLKRLINLLTPDKMRARRVVLNAYLAYAFTLEMIYFFMCAYANMLTIIGAPDFSSADVGADKLPAASTEPAAAIVESFGKASEQWVQALSSAPDLGQPETFNLGIPPSVSLAIALTIVGLAPSFPVLQRFEDWMRGAAHRLAGIPTRVINVAEDIRRNSLDLAESDPATYGKLLIPWGYWERIAFYPKAADNQLTAPDEFKHDLELIFATNAWILDRKLKLANGRERQRFGQVEEELRRRTEALILQLDEKSGFRSVTRASDQQDRTATTAVLEKGSGAEPQELTRSSWERLAVDVDDLADDLCILLALYIEHEMIEFIEVGEASTSNSGRQQDQAYARLRKFLGPQSTPSHIPSYAMVALLWTYGVTLFITFLWSLFPGNYEIELQLGSPQGVYWRVFTYAFYAVNAYGIPVTVALAIRDGALQSRRWRNVWTAPWTVRLPQSAAVFFLSWMVAVLFSIGIGIWQTAIANGWGVDTTMATQLRLLFEYNAPIPLRGAVLALIIIKILDARLVSGTSETARIRSMSTSLSSAMLAALIMGVSGGFFRYLTSLSSIMNGPLARGSLDDIDRGLIVYSALSTALVGFFVVFCLAEVVLIRDPSVARQKRLRSVAQSG